MAEPRQPPNNQDAERALLGAILVNPAALDAALTIGIQADDFYRPAHQHIYSSIISLHSSGMPVDTVTVADHLDRNGHLELAGGGAELIALHSAAPSSSGAASYARIIVDHAQLRAVIHAAEKIREDAYAGTPDVTGMLDTAQQSIFDVAQHRRTRNHAVRLGDNLAAWVDRLEQRIGQGEAALGVTTGLVDLDVLLLGLRPGQLITLAGRPGMGKSALGAQLARTAAETGHPTLLVSVEMSAEELEDRYVASVSQISLSRLRSGHVSDRDWPHITAALTDLAPIPLHVHDDPTASILSIRSEARRVSTTGVPVGLIVVDYLQLMDVAKRRENRQVEVSEVSAGLKRLARELKVPVVALAQLNRGLELRADKRPMLADLRESGAIENDSDVVIFIYRDDYYHPDTADRGVAELIVAKQRNGPTGAVKVAYFPDTGRFTNMTKAG